MAATLKVVKSIGLVEFAIVLLVVIRAAQGQRSGLEGHFAQRAQYYPPYYSGDFNRHYPNYNQNPFAINQNPRQVRDGQTRANPPQQTGQGTRAAHQGMAQGMAAGSPQGMGQRAAAGQAAAGGAARPGGRQPQRIRFVAPGQRLLG